MAKTLPSLGEDSAFATNSFPRQRRRSSNPRLMRLSAPGRSRRVPHRRRRRRFRSLPCPTTWLTRGWCCRSPAPAAIPRASASSRSSSMASGRTCCWRHCPAAAAALRLPAMYQWPEMAEEGGFAGYGPRITEWHRQLARLLAKVLRGAKPGDLPVEQPTKFELVINLQTAKAIEHEVPAGLVLRAD